MRYLLRQPRQFTRIFLTKISALVWKIREAKVASQESISHISSPLDPKGKRKLDVAEVGTQVEEVYSRNVKDYKHVVSLVNLSSQDMVAQYSRTIRNLMIWADMEYLDSISNHLNFVFSIIQSIIIFDSNFLITPLLKLNRQNP